MSPMFGSAYAGRYQVPFMPLLGIGFVGLWFYRQPYRRPLVALFMAVFLVSAFINFKGTLWST